MPNVEGDQNDFPESAGETTAAPYPYRGARLVLTEGLEAARSEHFAPSPEQTEFAGALTQVLKNCADILTVELFGNDQQRALSHQWMESNRQRSRR